MLDHLTEAEQFALAKLKAVELANALCHSDLRWSHHKELTSGLARSAFRNRVVFGTSLKTESLTKLLDSALLNWHSAKLGDANAMLAMQELSKQICSQYERSILQIWRQLAEDGVQPFCRLGFISAVYKFMLETLYA